MTTTLPRPLSRASRLVARLPIPRDWQPNPRVLLPMLPLIIFWVLTRTVPPQVAILGGFIAFCVTFYLTRETRAFQALAALGFAVLVGSTIVGLISTSEKAFLAAGPASDFIVAPIFLGSALVGRPLVGAVTKETVPGLARNIPANAPVFAWLTVVWAVYCVGTGVMQTLMLTNMSIGEYMLWSRVVGWPVNWAMLAIVAGVVIVAARRARDETRHKNSATP